MKKRTVLVLIFNLILIMLCSCNALNKRSITEVTEQVVTTQQHETVETDITPQSVETAEQVEATQLQSVTETTEEVTTSSETTAMHVHEYSETVAREAGCTVDGELVRSCKECGNTVTEAIPAVGKHSWDKGKVTIKATCAQEGTREYICTVCGSTKTESISKTDKHSWDAGKVSLEPTVTDEGIRTYTCSVCLDATKTETIEKIAVNHTYEVDLHHLKTTNNPNNYVDFQINGNILTVSGKIIQEYLESVWVRCDGIGTPVNVVSGEFFSVDISLEGVKDKADISVYTKVRGDEYYWSYIWDCVFVEYFEGKYRIAKSLVLEHNLEMVSKWIDPIECTAGEVSTQLRQLSKEIVGDEKDEYKKLYLINKWIAENICYDYDYYYNSDNKIYYSADDVYEQRRSVCEGYANLQKALIQAQGIPCIKVVTYSVGVDTIGYFDESNYQVTKGNHAHVEAYVNGRWVIMDATWDSNNKYENGVYTYKAPAFKYFDVTIEYFSYTHKLIKRN